MGSSPVAVKRRYMGLFFVTLALCACGDSMPQDTLERSRQMPQWFDEAKLGVFIHWGPAAVPAFAAGGTLQQGELEGSLLGDSTRAELPYSEWYLYAMNWPDSVIREHHAAVYGGAPHADFAPVFEQRVEESWDAEVWAELFDKAGARYVVLVTKHHDGYTLWPSAVRNPQQESWSAQRDMVGELAQAVRARGMRFGTYYSTGLDWSFALVAEGDLVRDMMLSVPGSEEYGNYVFDHMQELIERYRPDVMWADIGYPSSGRLPELLDDYFAAVPDGVVNDRWGAVDALGTLAAIPGGATIMKMLARWVSANRDLMTDDAERIGFKTAEYNSLPGIAPFKWESTRGIGGSFAYNKHDRPEDMLKAPELVRYLVDTVAKNGNVLINVGPDSYGDIQREQQAPLLGLGEWLQVNGEAIYATQPHTGAQNKSGRELRYTAGESVLYAIVYGAAETTFVIEHPGVEWTQLQVLGAKVIGTKVLSENVEGEALVITMDRELEGPASVVKFSLR